MKNFLIGALSVACLTLAGLNDTIRQTAVFMANAAYVKYTSSYISTQTKCSAGCDCNYCSK